MQHDLSYGKIVELENAVYSAIDLALYSAEEVNEIIFDYISRYINSAECDDVQTFINIEKV